MGCSGINRSRQHASRRPPRVRHARDLAGAQVEAARIYAETISGRRLQPRAESLKELDVLLAEWLTQIESEIAPETWKTYRGYCTNHFLPFFESADRILVRNPPRRSTGTAFDGGKRDKVRAPLTSEQAEAIIDVLPDRTPAAGYLIRALFTVIWDTSLRIGTMWRLEVPKHYKRGDDVLRISGDIDKSRYARSLPLTPRAQRTLDAICPDEGLIFRRFEYRRILVQAARKVLGTEHEAKHLSAHDFRHAALTHMAAVGSDLTAIGHIAGHKNATTTALYVHNSEAAAQSLAEPEFWTPKWTPRPAKHPIGFNSKQKWQIGSDLPFLVGHPGLEPGANGLRTQRLALHKALFVKGHHATYSGHRDRLDRAGLVAKIHAALDAKAVTPDDAANLIALIEGTLASRHRN